MTNGFTKTDAGWVFRVVEPTEFTRRYETAAWYSTVLVQPGDYPATFSDPHGRPVSNADEAHYAHAALPGRTTYDHFPTLLAGVHVNNIASGDRDEPTTFHIQSYAFNLTG